MANNVNEKEVVINVNANTKKASKEIKTFIDSINNRAINKRLKESLAVGDVKNAKIFQNALDIKNLGTTTKGLETKIRAQESLERSNAALARSQAQMNRAQVLQNKARAKSIVENAKNISTRTELSNFKSSFFDINLEKRYIEVEAQRRRLLIDTREAEIKKLQKRNELLIHGNVLQKTYYNLTEKLGSSLRNFVISYAAVESARRFGSAILNTRLEYEKALNVLSNSLPLYGVGNYKEVQQRQVISKDLMKDLSKFGERYAINIYDAMRPISQLIASPVEGYDFKQQYQLTKDLLKLTSVYKLSGVQLDAAFTAFSQMASKGTISMEELKRQLGQQLPGIIRLMSEGFGVSTNEFIDMVESGQLSATEFFKVLQKQIGIKFSDYDKAILDFTTALNSLELSFKRLMQTISEGPIGEFVLRLIQVLNGLLKTINYLLPYLDKFIYFFLFLGATKITSGLSNLMKSVLGLTTAMKGFVGATNLLKGKAGFTTLFGLTSYHKRGFKEEYRKEMLAKRKEIINLDPKEQRGIILNYKREAVKTAAINANAKNKILGLANNFGIGLMASSIYDATLGNVLRKENQRNYLDRALSWGLTGASTGMYFGPLGTLIGGLIGVGAGLLYEKNKKIDINVNIEDKNKNKEITARVGGDYNVKTIESSASYIKNLGFQI